MFCRDAMSEKWRAGPMGRTILSAGLFARVAGVFSTPESGPKSIAITRSAAISATADS